MLTGAEKRAYILERHLIINIGNRNIVFVLVTGKLNCLHIEFFEFPT